MGWVGLGRQAGLSILFLFFSTPPLSTRTRTHTHTRRFFFSRNLNNLCVLCCVFGFGIIPSWLVVDPGYLDTGDPVKFPLRCSSVTCWVGRTADYGLYPPAAYLLKISISGENNDFQR
jgi:hypothetical protein